MSRADDSASQVEGYTNLVHREGDTIVRKAGPWTPAVHAFLNHLDHAAPGIAPRVLELRDDREVLSYVPGWVPTFGDFATISTTALVSTGRLLRRLHGASAAFQLPDGVRWCRESSTKAVSPVVCHNDISPRNAVYRDGTAVAFIDWDFAGPEDPLWDLAHAVWQFAPLMSDTSCRARGWTDRPPDRRERLSAFLTGYGTLTSDDHRRLPGLVTKRVQATLDGIESLARTGSAVGARLVADGVTAELRDNLTWLVANTELPGILF